jgi:hypothetical protein
MGILSSTKFIALDSSLLGGLAKDYFSTKKSAREQVSIFLSNLLSKGFVPLICWHHFEELIRHRDYAVALDRIYFLRSINYLSWFGTRSEPDFLASIADIFVKEVELAIRFPRATISEIAHRTKIDLLCFGSGEQALEQYLGIWEDLRPFLWQRENRMREISSITQANVLDRSNDKLKDFLNGSLRPIGEAKQRLRVLMGTLTKELKQRGDNKLLSPEETSAAFIEEVLNESSAFYKNSGDPIREFLQNLGISVEELDPKGNFQQVTELAVLRKQLHIAAQNLGIPWETLKNSVNPERLPTYVIQRALKRHGSKINKVKGSDLTDNYLSCLAAYCDITFVDKRTKENARRAKTKDKQFAALVGRLEKASNYLDVGHKLHFDLVEILLFT